jgi:hypothetical protein
MTSNLYFWEATSTVVAVELRCVTRDANSITFGLYGREARANITKIASDNHEDGSLDWPKCSGHLTGPNWESTTKPPILKVVFTK